MLAQDFSWIVTIYKDAHLLKGLEMRASKNVKKEKKKTKQKEVYFVVPRSSIFLFFMSFVLNCSPKIGSKRSLTVNCDTAVVNSEQSQYSMLVMQRTVRFLEPYCPWFHYHSSWPKLFKTRQYGLKKYYFSRFVDNGKYEVN